MATKGNVPAVAQRGTVRSNVKRRARSGDGSIYREGGRFVAVVSVGSGAQRRRRKIRCESEGEAREALRRLRAELPTISVLADGAVTVETFLRAWLEEAVRPSVRPRTFVVYESAVRKHVYPKIGTVRLDRLRPEHLRAMFADLEREKVGPRMREVCFLRLKTSFGYAVGRSIATNPMLGVPRPRVPRRSMTTWSQEQARRFLEQTAGDELAPLYRLALTTGMRRGELLALRWSDVDLRGKAVSVTHTLSDDGELQEPKTPGSRRRIALPDRAVEALREQRARLLADGLRSSPWVFPVQRKGDGRRGEPRLYRAVVAAFERAAKAAKVPRIRFHDLRHTCATLHLANGTHPKVVSEMLGHASVEITLDLYSHVTPTLQREAADRFDSVL